MADEKKESKKLERVYTVNLSKAYEYLHTRRVERAVKLLRAFCARHMKADEKAVKLSEGTNSLLWRDSIQKPPRRIKVRLVADAGKVTCWLIGEEEAIAKKVAEEKKLADERAKKQEKKPEAKKDEKGKEEKKADSPKAEEKKADAPKKEAKAPNAAEAKMGDMQKNAMPASRKQI